MSTRKTKRKPPTVIENAKTLGRKPQFIVTDDILKDIRLMAGQGMTQKQIHHYFCVSEGVWYEMSAADPRMRVAVMEGKARAIRHVTSKLFEQINRGNMTAICFYMKTQANWKETSRLEVSQDDEPQGQKLFIDQNDPIEAARTYQQIMMKD